MAAESNEERQQLTEVHSQIQRARKTSIRTPAAIAQQKETLKRLIDLVQSPYSSLKSVAASNIKWFVKDFPELEDEAINAVYDLCEDADPKVRKDGYRAITSVSREQKKWVKRNADVLVQLLQSDEPEEVEVVEQQLTEHLDMDPAATMGVLCDQIVPIEDPQDEDDQATRDRLRSLVLAFMSGRAKRGIVERHANQYNTPAESILVSGSLKTIPKAPIADVNTIVKDVLLALPSYSKNSIRGNELEDALLSEAKQLYKSEVHGSEPSSIPKTRQFLELAAYVAVDKQASLPTKLLQFYCANFVSRVALLKLTEDAQAFIISNFADALAASEEYGKNEMDTVSKGLSSLRNQATDAVAPLLSRFIDFKEPNQRSWSSCRVLLRACARRQNDTNWVVPSHFVPILEKLQSQVSSCQVTPEEQSVTEEVESLIRSLLQSRPKTPNASVPASTTDANVAKGNASASSSKSNGGGPVQINRKRELSTSLPAHPQSAGAKPPTPSQLPASSPGTRADWQRQSVQASLRHQERQQPKPAPPPGVNIPSGEGSPTTKGKRDTGDSRASLLSRLAVNMPGSSANNSTNTRSHSGVHVTPAKRRSDSDSSAVPKRQHKQNDSDAPPEGGWSIKGAASKVSAQKGNGRDRTGSLLTRMNPSGGGNGEPRRRGRTRP